MKNQRTITGIFLIVGLVFVGINFFIMNSLQNATKFDLSVFKKVAQQNAKAQAVLPDLKPGESITKSKIRDDQISKVKNSLPYADSRFSLIYYSDSKYLIATVKASNIDKYRENKFYAEQKLYEFGAEDLCLLKVVWSVPVPLSQTVTSNDVKTSGCSA